MRSYYREVKDFLRNVMSKQPAAIIGIMFL